MRVVLSIFTLIGISIFYFLLLVNVTMIISYVANAVLPHPVCKDPLQCSVTGFFLLIEFLLLMIISIVCLFLPLLYPIHLCMNRRVDQSIYGLLIESEISTRMKVSNFMREKGVYIICIILSIPFVFFIPYIGSITSKFITLNLVCSKYSYIWECYFYGLIPLTVSGIVNGIIYSIIYCRSN